MTLPEQIAKFWIDPDTGVAMLPMADPYCKPYMYVRDCYAQYYDYVKSILASKHDVKYVTITGSDGIGKSMFYNWFFSQYRLDNPDQVIVCASFDKDRVMKSCVSFQSSMSPMRHADIIPEVADAIYMYDGPPRLFPKIGRMVAFVGSTDEWYDFPDIGHMITTCQNPLLEWASPAKMWGRHIKLYLPVWSLEELNEADKYLELKIGETDIYVRRSTFSGLPRYCLMDEEAYSVALKEFQDQLAESVETFDALNANYGTGRSAICRRVYPYGPCFLRNIYDDVFSPLPAVRDVIVGERVAILELCRLCKDSSYTRRIAEFIPICLNSYEKRLLKERRDTRLIETLPQPR